VNDKVPTRSSSGSKETRIAWAITGAGHTLADCANCLLRYPNVDIFLSRAAEEVIRIYALQDRLRVPGVRIYRETLASAPLVVRLFRGTYSVLWWPRLPPIRWPSSSMASPIRW